jgi:FkbM family methyltransferase
MIQPLIDTLKKYRTYYRMVKGWQALLIIVDCMLKSERERIVTLDGIKVHFRTNTPDLDIAISSLCEGEYANIKADYPEYIIDAGANIGTSALYFAKEFPHAKIIAIEPEEQNFEFLLKNTAPYKNIICIKAALWGREEKKEIRSRLTGHWGYTISETSEVTESIGQETSCVTIPSLMKKFDIETIDILKMDIEGGEMDVFKTSSDWIDSVKIITIELHDRICMGCDRSFYLSTQDFLYFERNGEKVTAYRDHP